MTETDGRKDDREKDRWELIPFDAMRVVVKVLTFGAKKYTRPGSDGAHNWRKVVAEPGGVDRYIGALLRHVAARQLGEETDPETGLPHLAHAAACVLFALAGELMRHHDSSIDPRGGNPGALSVRGGAVEGRGDGGSFSA